MSVDPSPPVVLALGGLVGAITIGLAVLAYHEFKDSNYRRMLLPVIVTTVFFTLAHGLLYLWPQHPPIVNALEPLSYTVLVLGVFRLVALHPEITVIARGDHR
jgi:CBS domain-containing protein